MRWGDMDAYGHINNVQIVRMLEELTDTDRDVRGDGWRARRHFVKSDGLGFSLSETIVDGGTGEAEYVLQTGGRPVVDDEEGEQSGAEGVQPPDFGGVADVGEDEGEGVEDDVGFAVFDLC